MARKVPATYETTVLDALESAAQEIVDLGQEMADWRDNMSNANMDHLPKYEQVEQAADELENADLERRVEELQSALEALAEGREFKAGCLEHVEGTPCKRCGWKGKAAPLETVQPLVEYPFGEGPKTDWGEHVTVDVARFGNISWTYDEGESREVYERILRRARADRQKEVEHAERCNANRLGHRLPDEPAIESFPGAEGLAEKKLVFRVAKKRQSRADRLDDARVQLEAALDAIDEFIEQNTACEADDRLADLQTAAQEVREGSDELQGVEFPGMFG